CHINTFFPRAERGEVETGHRSCREYQHSVFLRSPALENIHGDEDARLVLHTPDDYDNESGAEWAWGYPRLYSDDSLPYCTEAY
ncbi:hypothetical protein THAOC_07986, partial [Thalassiosira oceanica]